jgi:glutamine synthetase
MDGDVDPYLAFAAMVAAGLHSIENELELPPAQVLFDDAVTDWERIRLFGRG